jgi:hypothetical protein
MESNGSTSGTHGRYVMLPSVFCNNQSAGLQDTKSIAFN